MNLLPRISVSFLFSYCFKTYKTTKRHIYNIFKKKKDKKFCKNLILRPAVEVKVWLNTFNTIIADGEALMDELDAAGIITHNDSGPDEMRGSVEKFVSRFHKQLDVGVVVLGYDKHFGFCNLANAVTYLENPKCLFIATNMDTRSYANDMVIPGTGSFVAAIECCAGRKAIGIGKPSGHMCQQYIKNGLIVPRKTLMISDNCQTDIPFGHNLGCQTLLVGTGLHTWNDVQELKKLDSNEIKQFTPDAYIPKLADLS